MGLLSWLESNKFWETSSLEVSALLVFAGVGFAAASLGLVLQMNRSIAECNWEISKNRPSAYRLGQVYSIPSSIFIVVGFGFLTASLLLLLSTLLPGEKETLVIQNIRLLLRGIAYIAIVTMVCYVLAILVFRWILAKVMDRTLYQSHMLSGGGPVNQPVKKSKPKKK